MKILAIDIGTKTQDILLYDDTDVIENCIKLVFPSPVQVYKKKISEFDEDLFIKGDTIGGGAFAKVLKEYVKKHHIFMTKQAAHTIKDDLDIVKSCGIKIIDNSDAAEFEKKFNGKTINLQEIDLNLLENILLNFKEKLDIDYIAVAVQDHGAAPKGVHSREFRFKLFLDQLKKSRKIEDFAFKKPPEHYLRMTSVFSSIKRQTNAQAIVMDTSPDSIAGCLEDEKTDFNGPTLIINIGNSHSIFMILSEGKVDALMEHHTRYLNNPVKLEDLVRRFADGNVTNNEIFSDGGNGAIIINNHGFDKLKQIVVTGPKRNIFKKTNLNVYYAAPAGDMMMTGPIGLIRCIKKKYKLG